jgi:hypothetical protein
VDWGAVSGGGEVTRSRASAKKAGASFERSIADGLKVALDNDFIDRKPRGGAFDTGDIGGVRIDGHRLVIEAKNCTRMDLPTWTREAKQEAANDGALAGLVVHKRHGTTDPMKQWVTCTVAELVALITKLPPEELS